MRVASIEDERVQDEELVMAIGKYNDFGLKDFMDLKQMNGIKILLLKI